MLYLEVVTVWRKPINSLIIRCSHKGKVACSLSMCQVFPAARVNFWQPNQPNFHAAWNNTFCRRFTQSNGYMKCKSTGKLNCLPPKGLFQPGNSERFMEKFGIQFSKQKMAGFPNPRLFESFFSMHKLRQVGSEGAKKFCESFSNWWIIPV